MSVTGPHTRDWQSCGVANSSATGFSPTTSSKLRSCMSLGGVRVSSSSSSPPTEASVSVATFGAGSPTSGISSAFLVETSTASARRRRCCRSR